MSYRDQGKARSPALEKLASESRANDRAPVQTMLLSNEEVTRRLELAVGVRGDDAAWWGISAFFLSSFAIYAAFLAAEAGFDVEPKEKLVTGLLVISAIASIGGAFYLSNARTQRRANAIATELTWEKSHPFPVTGYRDWIVNDRSVLIVELRAGLDKATVQDAVKAIDPAIETTVTADTRFELVLPSRVLPGEDPARFGDLRLLKTVFDRLVRPLHDDVGIERVTMGGTIQDR